MPAPPTSTIDPRIAAAGGTYAQPNQPGSGGYNYPGMATASHWAATQVGKVTDYYGCAFCGQKFRGPHAFYTHAAKVHPSKRVSVAAENHRRARDAPSEADPDPIPVSASEEA